MVNQVLFDSREAEPLQPCEGSVRWFVGALDVLATPECSPPPTLGQVLHDLTRKQVSASSSHRGVTSLCLMGLFPLESSTDSDEATTANTPPVLRDTSTSNQLQKDSSIPVRATLARQWQTHLRSRSFNGVIAESAPPPPLVWNSSSSQSSEDSCQSRRHECSPKIALALGPVEGPKPPMSKATMEKMARLREERRQKQQVRNAASVPNLAAHQRALVGVKKSLKQVNQDSWTLKVEAMQQLGRAAASLDQQLLNQVVRCLLQEIRNLRSSVSRCAITTLGQLFEQQPTTAMETHLDPVCQCLLQKSGENVLFIRQDVDRTLEIILEHSSPTKMAFSLLDHGAQHRNASVRRTSSHFVYRCLEKIGPENALENRQLTEKIIANCAHWLMDTAPLTRYYGRSTFALLGTLQPLDKLAQHYLTPSMYRNVQSILKVIQDKGVGDRPQDKHSAVGAANVLPNRTQSRR